VRLRPGGRGSTLRAHAGINAATMALGYGGTRCEMPKISSSGILREEPV